jgi:hypothetical protein
MSSPDVLTLARTVLARNRPQTRDTAWDSCGTEAKAVSHAQQVLGTTKGAEIQTNNASVPLSQTLGRGTAGQLKNPGTVLGTVAGRSYGATFAALRANCPAYVDEADWQQAVADADAFLATWAVQAVAFDWSVSDLFGLHPVPEQPGPTYRRLSRRDCTGLIWFLHGRPVVAMTAAAATFIKTASGGTVTYYKRAERQA